MHRHTRCMGVGGVMLLRGVSLVPRELGGLIHRWDSMGDLPKFGMEVTRCLTACW